MSEITGAVDGMDLSQVPTTFRYEMSAEGKLLAGSSMAKGHGCKSPNGAPPRPIFSSGTASSFQIRGKAYMADRKKVEAAGPMYEMAGMDLVTSERRLPHVTERVCLKAMASSLPTLPAGADVVPPLLIVNVQLPTTAPSLLSNGSDGPGLQLVLYYRLTAESAAALEEPGTASEALRLWLTYCASWAEDDICKGRLKVVAIVANMDELGLPGFITKYNGKPVLINRSGSYIKGQTTSASGEEVSYLEMGINVHAFSFIAKKGLNTLLDRFPEMVLHIGFVIEGRDEVELPEAMLACTTLNNPPVKGLASLEVDGEEKKEEKLPEAKSVLFAALSSLDPRTTKSVGSLP
ncbi:unnamed protein product [Chrysoparadoxa australica]